MGAVCCRAQVSPSLLAGFTALPRHISPSTLMAKSIFSTSCSYDVWGKALLARLVFLSHESYLTSINSSRFGSSSTSKPASSMPSNTSTRLSAWRWELFQMLYRREGCWKRFVQSISLHFSDQRLFSYRLTIPLSSTCGMHFKTTRIVSS